MQADGASRPSLGNGVRCRRSAALLRPAAALLALPLASCSYDGVTFLLPHGPVAEAQRGYFIGVILILLIVVLPVLLLVPVIAWRYRYRNASAAYRPDWSFSWTLEILSWGVPACVVVVLAVWLWRGTHELDPYAPMAASASERALPVEVIGYDWKWLFVYPTLGVASVGRLAFPADRPLAIALTSDTVMQSFFIPALGSQIYAMPGMVTKLHLKADTPGAYLGENTQYNGEGFHRQRFTATAMTEGDFSAWLEEVKAAAIPLTPVAYGAIGERGDLAALRKALDAEHEPAGAIYFSGVGPELFARIVASFHGGPKDAAALIGAAPPAIRASAPGDAPAPPAPTPARDTRDVPR